MKTKIIKRLILIVVALSVIVSIAACSPREEPITDDLVTPGTGGGTVSNEGNVSENLTQDEATDLINEAIENYKYLHTAPDDPEWYVIDLNLEFSYDYFWLDESEKYESTSSFQVVLQANMNLEDNSQSQIYFQLRNASSTPILCFYYVENYAYFVIGENRYYARELNFSQIGNLINDGLGGLGIDIFQVLAGLVVGNTGVELVDQLAPVLAMLILNRDNSLLTSYDMDADGNYATRTIGTEIKLNSVLDMLAGRGLSFGDITISFGTLWDLVGINLDPILGQFLGFTVAELGEKDWPQMQTMYNVITERTLITRVDDAGYESQEYGYAASGWGLSIQTANGGNMQKVREDYASVTPETFDPETSGDRIEEYNVQIELSPMLYASDEPISINFANLNVNESGRDSVYTRGGLGNIGLGATLYAENDDNGRLTLNAVLGDLFDIDLGALGDMAIDFPYASRYEFNLDVNLALDFFNGADTEAEITLSYNSSPLIRAYLGNNTLYLNFDNLRTAGNNGEGNRILPNIQIPGFNINSMLDGVLLDMLQPYINPDYVAPDTASNASGPLNDEGDGTGTAASVDVMALISTLIDNFEFPGRGEYVVDADGNLKLDENGNPIPNNFDISLILDSAELSDLFAGFGIPVNSGGQLGEDLRVELYFNQYDPINTLELFIDITDTVRAGLKLDKLTYLREPTWSNREMVSTAAQRAEYVSLGVTLDESGNLSLANSLFEFTLGGDVTFGLNETSDTGIDLSDLIGAFVENILLSIGITEDMRLTLEYEVIAKINLMNLADMELRLDINDGNNSILTVYYTGNTDTLWLDLERLGNLGIGSLGTLPRLRYDDLGLAPLLADVDIVGLLASLLIEGYSSQNAQNSITVDTSDTGFIYNTFSTLNTVLLGLGYLSNLPADSELNIFNLAGSAWNDEGDGTGTDTSGGLDIMSVIGALLDRAEIDAIAGTLSVYIASNVLTSLISMLIVDFPADATLPEVEAFLEIHLANIDFNNTEDGLLRIVLNILDSGDPEIRAVEIELDILKDIRLECPSDGNGTNLWASDESGYQQSFVTLQSFLDTLTIGLALNGHFDLTVADEPVIAVDDEGNQIFDPEGNPVYETDDNGNILYQTVQQYTNDYLNGLLSGLLPGLGLMVDTSRLNVELGFEIIVKLSLAGVLKLDGSEGVDPIEAILGGSEALIRLYDREAGHNDETILALYLVDNNLYLDLSYFGIPNIGITDVNKLISDITELTSSPTPEAPEGGTAENAGLINESSLNLLNIDNAAHYANTANPEAVALQALISPESISVTLAKDAIAALLGLFLTSELPIEIQDTSLEIGYEGGNITLGLETGVEVFELSLGIDRFRVAVDSSEMGDFTVNAPDASDYYMTEAGMPTNINLSLGAEIGINSEPAVNSDRNTIDLSPALSGLLGDVELNVLIEFLGLIDEKLFLTVDGSINLEEIVNIATNGFDFAALERTALMLRLSTYASADENDIDSSTGERRLRTVMSIYYIEGDLYLNIDTSIVGLDHIMIPDANEVISSLISSVTGGGAAGDVSNAPYLTEGEVTADEVVYTYIDLALADGGLSLTLTKDFLMGIFLALGLDIGSYLESLNLEVSAAATLNPLEISLSLGIQDLGDGSEGSGSEFVELSASIGDLSLGFDTELTISDDEKAEYALIEDLRTLGVTITGVLKAEISAPADVTDPETGAEGNIHAFTDVFKAIAEALDQSAEKDRLVWIREQALLEENQALRIENGWSHAELETYLGGIYDETVAPMSYEGLLNVGLVLEVLDDVIGEDGDAVFGGEIYYTIEAILDITDIMNLKMSLFLNSAPGLNGDIMSVSVMGVYDEESGAYDINLFADLTNLLSEGIVIDDMIRISHFDEFSAYMENFAATFTGKNATVDPVAMNSENNGLELPRNSSGDIAGSVMTGAAFVLAITSSPDDFGIPNGAPISVVAPTAAIYALIGSLLQTANTEYVMPVDESLISNYITTGTYTAAEVYYAVRGASRTLRDALTAAYSAGSVAESAYNAAIAALDALDESLRDAFINPNFTGDAERLAAYATAVNIFTMAFDGIEFGGYSDAETLKDAFDAVYSAAADNTGGYTQETHEILILGLREDRIDELDEARLNGTISDRDYEYLVNGMIGKIDGTTFPGGEDYIDPDLYPTIDMSKFFGEYMPSGLIQIGASEVPDGEGGTRTAFLLLNLSIENLLEIQFELGSLEITVSPDESYYVGTEDQFGNITGGLLNAGYYHLDPQNMESHNIALNISGEIDFAADDTVVDMEVPANNTAINFTELIQSLFTTVLGFDSPNFGAILENYGYDPQRMTFELGLLLNMGDLMRLVATGDIYAFLVDAELSLELGFIDRANGGLDYISMYYIDGTAYIDGSIIGIQKIRVDRALGQLLELFGIDISGYYDDESGSGSTDPLDTAPSNAPANAAALSAPLNADGDEPTGGELIPYLHVILGNSTGVVLDFLGPVIFSILSNIGVSLGDKPLGELIDSTLNGDLELQLGIMTKLGLLDRADWTDEEGEKDALSLALKAGNYTVGLAVSELEVDLMDSSQSSATLLPPDFNANEYPETDNLSTVYLNFSLEFDIDGDGNTTFGLDETLDAILAQFGVNDDGTENSVVSTIRGLGLAPVITLLNTISSHFVLEFEGNINFTEIIDEQSLYSSNFSIVLRDRTETAVYDGVEKYKEIFSGHHYNEALYLNFEVFNFQAVRIDNFYQFLIYDLLPGYGVNLGSPEEGTDTGTEGADMDTQNAGYAGYASDEGFDPFAILRQMPEGATEIATYLNLLLCPEGFCIGIGTAALFGILTAIGGEAMDFSSYVEPIGEVDLDLTLFGDDEILGLGITFEGYEYNGDERVNVSDDPENPEYLLSGDTISLGLKLSNDFTVAFTYQWTEDVVDEDGNVTQVTVDRTMEEPEVAYLPDGTSKEYAVLDPTNPVIGLSTTLFLDVSAGRVTGTGTEGAIFEDTFTGYELNREPLTSLLAGVIDVTLSVLLEIIEDQEFSLEIEILANLPLRNLRGIEMQLTIKRVDNDHNYNIVRANLHNSNLYIDLTNLNGPRFIIEEVVETILGEKEFDDSVLGGLFGTGSAASSAPANAAGGAQNAPGDSGVSTPIGIDLGRFFADIGTYGLALYLTESALDSVLGTFGMADFRIFNEFLAELYLAPKDNSLIFGLGVSANAQYDEIDENGEATGETAESEVLGLGLGLDGLRLNFEAFSSDVLLIPQTSYYIPAHTVNTITLDAAFQIDFSTKDGIINLQSLYESLFDPNGDLANVEGVKDSAFGILFSEDSPLTSVLPQMVMLGDIGDVITMEITGYLYIRGGLDGLLENMQLRVMFYTNNEKFSKENDSYLMAFYYHENDLYADLSKLGLGKVSAPEMPNVINFLINGRAAHRYCEDTPFQRRRTAYNRCVRNDSGASGNAQCERRSRRLSRKRHKSVGIRRHDSRFRIRSGDTSRYRNGRIRDVRSRNGRDSRRRKRQTGICSQRRGTRFRHKGFGSVHKSGRRKRVYDSHRRRGHQFDSARHKPRRARSVYIFRSDSGDGGDKSLAHVRPYGRKPEHHGSVGDHLRYARHDSARGIRHGYSLLRRRRIAGVRTERQSRGRP